MPRGARSKVGDTTTNQNGYLYTKTEDRGWVGTHILIMEEHLGRRLQPGEYVRFKDGHEPPITIDMLELRKRGDFRTSARARLAQLDARIEELQAERELVLKEIDDGQQA